MNAVRNGIFAILLCGVVATAEAQEPKPARPVEPITAILEAFRTHDMVALGEGAHGNEPGHAFRLSLIRDPRFAAAVNDIVIEFGNARYQDTIDRFVHGEQIPDTVLRRVWQDTTQVTPVWDRPIYEEFLRAVRAVNLALPRERRLRVLLGDPPIDWDDVRTFEDYNRWMADGNRNRFPADVIRREVVAKKRRALVIYGEAHLTRGSAGQSIVGLLEGSAQVKIFSIASPVSMPMAKPLTTIQADAGTWPVPSVAILRGTVLGATPITALLPVSGSGGQRTQPVMEDQFDAILYLGDPSTITINRLSAEKCADGSYMAMRHQRLSLMPPPLAKVQGERLNQECAR